MGGWGTRRQPTRSSRGPSRTAAPAPPPRCRERVPGTAGCCSTAPARAREEGRGVMWRAASAEKLRGVGGAPPSSAAATLACRVTRPRGPCLLPRRPYPRPQRPPAPAAAARARGSTAVGAARRAGDGLSGEGGSVGGAIEGGTAVAAAAAGRRRAPAAAAGSPRAAATRAPSAAAPNPRRRPAGDPPDADAGAAAPPSPPSPCAVERERAARGGACTRSLSGCRRAR